MLYLDFAASSPIREKALNVLEVSFRENFANPSSTHKLGKELHRRIETCRSHLLEFVGAGNTYRLIFTSSATESNNTVTKGLNLGAGDSVIFSTADHPSITAPMTQLKESGVTLIEMPLDEYGAVRENQLMSLIDEKVKLVNLTHVNNQSGTINDITGISRLVKNLNPQTHIHVDAAQGFGKVPFTLQEGNIDSLSTSAHKTGGPKGIAGLYLHDNTSIRPLITGGGQEDGLRSSTQAAPLVFSFYEAAKESVEGIESMVHHVAGTNRVARECLKEKIPEISFPFWKKSSPYILAFLLPGISSDIILRHLEQQDIIISSRAACSSRIKGLHPVFSALNLPEKVHKFVLRLSFSHVTTNEDIFHFCNALATIYDDLKRFIR